ncbi:MAG TPA: hypothetical protein VHC67_17855 [Gaiellaceae bacterium]|nr:hypothetical protein [Gaiellaceae bacterium]
MRSRTSGLLLVPAAALVVHQARYSLAYGPRASSELAAQGHSYLSSVVPWAVLALGLAATAYLRRVALAYRTGDAGTRVAPVRLWALTTAGLLAIYAVQETLEGFTASGHPGGMGGVFGHGGWWAVPASALVAIAVVALLRLGEAVVRFAARIASRAGASELPRVFPGSAELVPVRVRARSASGRAPPRRRS